MSEYDHNLVAGLPFPSQALIAWETGLLAEQDEIQLFQQLVSSGLAWRLQGLYGRTAAALVEAGLVELPR